MFESFKIETKEMLDWDLINKFYEIETIGYKKVFPNNSLYSILVNQFKNNFDEFLKFIEDKLLIKHDKTHTLYWKPEIIPDLK